MHQIHLIDYTTTVFIITQSTHLPFKNCKFHLWLKLCYFNNYTYFIFIETGNLFIPRRRHTVCAMPRLVKTVSFLKKYCTLCS